MSDRQGRSAGVVDGHARADAGDAPVDEHDREPLPREVLEHRLLRRAARDQEPVDPEFARGVRACCDRIGAALILDDVRCGLRIDPRGSWESIGVRPDLSAWSKSLANGYPLAALLGAEPLREAAGRIWATGSFWFAGAPMAAALTSLRIFNEIEGVELMRASGRRLQEGLVAQAASHGLRVRVTGPPQLPLLLFADDPEFDKVLQWARACARCGVYLHPVHNWFLSTAHDRATIDEALARTDDAFREVRQTYGAD